MGLSQARWVGPPRHWSRGRGDGGRGIRYVVIHATDGSEGPASAEAGAAYDKTRPDSVSTHLFVDSDSAVREVADVDTAFAAYPKGNAIGVQVEICGRAAQTLAQWSDASSVATLEIAAREVAAICLDHGLPPRHLSVAETRAAWFGDPGHRPAGIVGHWDVTRAYPEDGGSHTDPGPNFPWATFLMMVSSYMAPLPTHQQGETMRYSFDGTFTDRPAELGARIVRTTGLGDYFVEPFSMPDAGLVKATTIRRGGPAGADSAPVDWSFGKVFAALTGGCAFDTAFGHGLASWRQAETGPHTHSISGSGSGSASVSVSGNTGPATPSA